MSAIAARLRASRLLGEVDSLLRGTGVHAVGGGRVPWVRIGLVLIVTGFAYGCVMGYFAGRPRQAFYSGLKVPLLLVVSTLICLPNYFMVNTVLGLRDDFAAAFRGVLSSQGTVAVVLAALAPLTALGYVSSSFYPFATVTNGVMFALASIAGQVTLARHYRPLIAKNPKHRVCLRGWLVLYVFVAIQLAWVLRPFIGAPRMRVRFLRHDAWGNAYVHVTDAVWQVLTGQ